MLAISVRSLMAVCAGVFMALVGGCANSSVQTVWRAPGEAPVSFTKVLAIGSNTSPAERRAGEDTLVEQFKTAMGVASYTLIPDEELKDKEKVLAALRTSGFDGVAVIRMTSAKTTTTYVRPTYMRPDDMWGGSGGFSSYSGGYTTEDTVITAEVSLYAYKDMKESLIWSGSSTTTNPTGMRDFVVGVSKGSVEELKRQKLLP